MICNKWYRIFFFLKDEKLLLSYPSPHPLTLFPSTSPFPASAHYFLLLLFFLPLCSSLLPHLLYFLPFFIFLLLLYSFLPSLLLYSQRIFIFLLLLFFFFSSFLRHLLYFQSSQSYPPPPTSLSPWLFRSSSLFPTPFHLPPLPSLFPFSFLPILFISFSF